MILTLLKARFKARALSAFILGACSALAMAPLSLWAILFIGVGGFYWILSQCSTARQAFIVSWLFGFGYFLFSLSWIGSALLVEGNGYAWAYPLAVSGIPFGLAFFWGFAGMVAHWARRLGDSAHFLAFVLSFTAFEVARGYAFTGFPWNLFGYTWVEVKALIQIVSVISVYGLTGLTIFWCGVAGFVVVSRSCMAQCVAVVLAVTTFAGSYAYGSNRLAQRADYAPPPVVLKIVPGDIPQSLRWDNQYMLAHFRQYLDQSMPAPSDDRAKPTLIVWPETTIVDWHYSDAILLREITDMLAQYEQAVLITGALRRDGDAVYNSMIAIDSDGQIFNVYDKSHLVPFGEYIPFQNYIPLDPVNNFSGFVAGGGAEIFTIFDDVTYAPAICYEIIFPHSLLPSDQAKPDFIINVTNDAWYEGSAGPAQHFTQVIFRAIEYGVPVVRAANKGISAAINPYGFVY